MKLRSLITPKTHLCNVSMFSFHRRSWKTCKHAKNKHLHLCHIKSHSNRTQRTEQYEEKELKSLNNDWFEVNCNQWPCHRAFGPFQIFLLLLLLKHMRFNTMCSKRKSPHNKYYTILLYRFGLTLSLGLITRKSLCIPVMLWTEEMNLFTTGSPFGLFFLFL